MTANTSIAVFTGIEGVLVDLKDTIRSFKAIMNGEGDDLPEGAVCFPSFRIISDANLL